MISATVSGCVSIPIAIAGVLCTYLPSTRCFAIARALSGGIRDPHSAVPLRSENSFLPVEHARIRHRPPPFPLRTRRLPAPQRPRSAQSALTQHRSSIGRPIASTNSSRMVVLVAMFDLRGQKFRHIVQVYVQLRAVPILLYLLVFLIRVLSRNSAARVAPRFSGSMKATRKAALDSGHLP